MAHILVMEILGRHRVLVELSGGRGIGNQERFGLGRVEVRTEAEDWQKEQDGDGGAQKVVFCRVKHKY